MELQLFQVDAFTDRAFGGNSACVVPLTHWLSDEILLKITQENAVAETAFFIPFEDHYHIRWFTPEIEMDLCGHATLAAAHVLKRHLKISEDLIRFESNSGELAVTCAPNHYTLNFPSRRAEVAAIPQIIKNGISRLPKEVYKSRDYMLVYDHEEEIKDIVLDRRILDQINLDPGGIILTAPGISVDFVSRYFTTQSSIFEDPVTGSAHCSLIPFWSERLNKQNMVALQISSRVGKLWCAHLGDRVTIAGEAITYMEGVIRIE